MRPVKAIYDAEVAHMPGLKTWRAMPTSQIRFLDPFLFLNHHGPEDFPQNNNGLPFGPHPHRGFETLTYILDGELIHQDTTGYKSKITSGGVQWMTAGSGLLHSETSSEEFKAKGGDMELIQLWLNLPAKHKMVSPAYKGLQKEQIETFTTDDDVAIHLISGEIFGHKGPIDSLTQLTMSWIDIPKDQSIKFNVPSSHQILLYVVNGRISVNNQEAETRQLVEFEFDDGALNIEAHNDSRILFGHGAPFNEPIAAQGPFVMNTREELRQAFIDYEKGKLGVWDDE